MLRVNNLEVVYSDIILVLRGISLEVPEGNIIAFLGSNGAGKSTTLRAVSGLLDYEDGEIKKGTIEFRGMPIHTKEPSEIVRLGITQVPEGRRIFAELTVDENIRVGAHTRSDAKAEIARDYELCLGYFPALRERLGLQAGFMSGGEQQMLAIARGLMSKLKLLMLDEMSLGLMPSMVEKMMETISAINRAGTTVLLVEQMVQEALEIARRGYVIQTGKIVHSGSARELLESEEIRKAYLGM